ncbi:hypothetical protein CRUP_015731 [Coryphaenoides rupestris]|nr:hypothetical protein CRUP_015731 [Coryphaenoides rupestris]
MYGRAPRVTCSTLGSSTPAQPKIQGGQSLQSRTKRFEERLSEGPGPGAYDVRPASGSPLRAAMRGFKTSVSVSVLLSLLSLSLFCGSVAEAARSRRDSGGQNSFRRAASGVYQTLSSVFGEDNIRGLYKFFSKTTERFVHASNLSHYFSPTSLTNSPARALLLVAAVLLAYWCLSLVLSGLFYLLHSVFGRFFWAVRVFLFAMACLYILQKFEGDAERAVLPLCFVMAVYFMTGPVGSFWRRGGGGAAAASLEEKIDQLDTQVRLLNIRLCRVMDSMERSADN